MKDFFDDEPQFRGLGSKLEKKDFLSFDAPVYRSVDAGMLSLSIDDLPRPKGLMRSGPSIGKDMSLSSDLRHSRDAVKPLPLPEYPIYHEPRSSFTSSNLNILEEIASDLQLISGLDVQFLSNLHKIKCCAHIDGDSCTFRVYMFKGQVKGQFLVEFQRRSGCCIIFRKVYSKVSGRFLPKEKQDKPTPVPSLGVVVLDDVTADLLADMLAISKSDQQRETLRLLADCSTSEENRNKIISVIGVGKLVGILLDAITSNDRDSETYACILLANLCSSSSEYKDSVQKQVADQMFAPLCGLLRLDSLGSSETKRHVLKCIESLPPALVGEVRKRHSEALKNLSASAQQGKLLLSNRLSPSFLEV